MNCLEQLKRMTTVVADTGDFESMHQYQPSDATTNPSLILAAVQLPQYQHLLHHALEHARRSSIEPLREALEQLTVEFGLEILKLIPGRVSTEVDARLSFDTGATIDTARSLISRYQRAGVEPSRVLIKIAATWEGIEAARQLEQEGIHCNLTLLFSLSQAIACAEAGVSLISPFVGRIYDWHKADRGVEHIEPGEDPGVHSVQTIYRYFKKYGYTTEVMGASFRNIGEILELAGCDLLTIAPALLAELEALQQPLTQKLDPESARSADIERIEMNEQVFRWRLNEDAMATEKLAEGIRRFSVDQHTLAQQLQQAL